MNARPDPDLGRFGVCHGAQRLGQTERWNQPRRRSPRQSVFRVVDCIAFQTPRNVGQILRLLMYSASGDDRDLDSDVYSSRVCS